MIAGLALAGLAACSSEPADSAPSTVSPIATATTPTSTTVAASLASPTTLPATTATTAAASAAPTTTVTPTTIPDGATVLQQSFDQLAGGYHFVTTATVNETPVLTAEGDHIGGSTRMTITSQGRSVEYIVLPEQTWVADAGQWQELDEPAPAGDPITPLRGPESVTVANHAPELTTLMATYPPSALALPGDQPVTVAFELSGTSLRTITYEAPGATSSVRAEISELVDTTPITSPAGA